MDITVSILIAGFFGGVIRGLIGFLKHKFSYKNVKFELTDFLATVFLSGVIGISVASAVAESGVVTEYFFTPALSFIVGYAGGDFVENIYKMIIKKPSLYLGKKENKEQ
jgi:FtsH-binding integral membrane protein